MLNVLCFERKNPILLIFSVRHIIAPLSICGTAGPAPHPSAKLVHRSDLELHHPHNERIEKSRFFSIRSTLVIGNVVVMMHRKIKA